MKRFAKIQTIFLRAMLTLVVFVSPFLVVVAKPPVIVLAAQTQPSSGCCTNGPSLSTLSTSKATGAGETCFVKCYADPFLAFLAALVGIFVIISIIWAGIQYSSSTDDPSKVQAAKNRIRDAVISIMAFLLIFAFLKWLVPGGI